MLPQRLLGRDLFWWLTRLGLITKTADSRLARRLQKRGDLVIGTRWRDLARLGIHVRPRLDDVDLTTAMFADGSVTTSPPSCGPPASAPTTRGSTSPAPSWTTRSRTSAASPPFPGLSIVGLPWLHTRGSALLGYVKDDAAWLANHIRDDFAAARTPAPAGDLFV